MLEVKSMIVCPFLFLNHCPYQLTPKANTIIHKESNQDRRDIEGRQQDGIFVDYWLLNNKNACYMTVST